MAKNVLNEDRVMYTVAIRRADGTEFLSSGNPAWLAYFRRDAVAHQRKLRAGGFRGRVVKVRVRVEVIGPTPRAKRKGGAAAGQTAGHFGLITGKGKKGEVAR